ncbi:glycosyltransferase BC10 isoform X7 [Beta vulgaris subsp. vulgaris]|uniref:glycosyltransferase BC10 isoform X7 n=1 Tax=Beta vulgaris subsp. vulgaris TaxID=3555 RepID=UPI0020372181|nr:glycosyltransferase BC10 isoform X7 [Beta vulgaris subsp. vulgaris]
MKRRTSFQNRSQQKWKSRLLFMLLLCLCVGSFILLLESNPPTMNLPILFAQKPKIAFLFIARNRLPLDFVWDVFFQIDWGEASMIQAERILLQKALVDHTNERFVFLSDSFADTKEGRYNPKMHPVVPVNNWRKGSQWVVLNRKHAETVVKDETVFPVFQQHCKCVQLFREHIPKKKSEDQQDSSFDRIISSKRKSLPEFWRDQPFPVDTSKEHNCIPDEHYIQTLLAQEGLEKEITRRSLTHTAWDLSVSKDNERRGWHPVTYKFSDATSQLIHSIKEIDNIFYETENRREWCSSKGKPSPCFLFARKFTRPAASRILNLSVLGT